MVAASKLGEGQLAHVLSRAREDREEAAKIAALVSDPGRRHAAVLVTTDYLQRCYSCPVIEPFHELGHGRRLV